MEMTTMHRTIAAEARAVEEGHHLFVQPGGWGKVVSETVPGKWYRVEAVSTADGRIVFSCQPEGERAYDSDHMATTSQPGACSCKHQSLLARRMEREHIARFDAERGWVADVDRVHALTAPEPADEADPFAGLA